MAARIAFLSWSPEEITGGIKFAFRCAEILKEHGADAFVAVDRERRPGWFESSATIRAVSTLDENDILVFPENHHGYLARFATTKNPKVVFCQNPYGVCRGLGGGKDYADFGVTHVLGLGAHATRFCRARFPSLKTFDVQCFIDHNLFTPPPTKRLQIAFIPKKRPLEAMFVKDMVRYSAGDRVRQIPWIPIENMSERQVANVMRDSAIFISYSRFEAYAFNILEAMSCGCVVAGFTGTGALEYCTSANGFFVPEDDCFACVEAVKNAIQCVTGGGKAYQDMINEGIATGMKFNRQRFVHRFVDVWRQIAEGLKTDIGIQQRSSAVTLPSENGTDPAAKKVPM